MNKVYIEKRWDVYHKFEQKNKGYFLRNLSARNSFRILKELHTFAYTLKDQRSFNKLDMTKIKLLASVHAIFGKVKS